MYLMNILLLIVILKFQFKGKKLNNMRKSKSNIDANNENNVKVKLPGRYNTRRGEYSANNNIDSAESTILNRLSTRAQYDSDNETNSGLVRVNHHASSSSRANEVHYDEETMDVENFNSIDENSNTQRSTSNGTSMSTGATRLSSELNSQNSNGNHRDVVVNGASSAIRTINTRYNYSNATETIASNSDSSEYSDWAEEDGRRELRPPPLPRSTTKRLTRRQAKANYQQSQQQQYKKRRLRSRNYEDSYEEPDSNKSNHLNQSSESISPMVISKRQHKLHRKKIISDDDDNCNSNQNKNSSDEDEESSIINNKKQSRSSNRKPRKAIISDEDNADDENTNHAATVNSEDDEEAKENGQNGVNEESFDSKYTNSEEEENNCYDDEITDQNGSQVCTSHAVNTRSSKLAKNVDYRKKSENSPRKLRSHASKNPKSIPRSATSSSSLNRKMTDKKMFEEFKECPEGYKPPEWLTSSRPKKSPYVPQIGDEVVYFKQGHQLYLNAVRTYNIYELNECEMKLPNNVAMQEYCKVIGFRVEIKPPRLVCLRLNVIDESTNKLTDAKFSIKYHDMSHVVDFIILRQYYERALEKNWRPRDRFRCVIDDVWWTGVIEAKKPFQQEYPNSLFQCIRARWENGDSEELSPWDLEPVPNNARYKSKQAITSSASIGSVNAEIGLPITSDELKEILYFPHADDWPECDRDTECDRILKGLEVIMQLSIAEYFSFPVDLDAYPNYAIKIGYPIDLNTIKERLENRYYRRLIALQWDVGKLETNAIEFNQLNSEIVHNASLLNELLQSFIQDTNCFNPMPLYKQLCQSRNLPLTDRICNSLLLVNGERREIITNAFTNGRYEMRNRAKYNAGFYEELAYELDRADRSKNVLNNDWQEECKRLLVDMIARKDSAPFRAPVDLNDYPDYLEKVQHPIDLSTISNRLSSGNYDLAKFDADLKLMFANSRLYNTKKRSRVILRKKFSCCCCYI
jgi:hypothetical protein